jgi:peptidoglycan/LPS O-acetylase OafA/YrhL
VGETNFKPGLESLRGLAALTVAVAHGMSAFKEVPSPLRQAVRALTALFQPSVAVIIFFVLSGYVLGRSLERKGDYIPFLIRRAFRIVPPFVLSLLFGYVCLSAVHLDALPDLMKADFIGQFPGPTIEKLWDNLVFNSTWINGPTWSIYPELVCSALMPILIFGHRLVGPRYRWAVFVITMAAILLTSERIVLYFYIGYFVGEETGRLVSERFWLGVALAISGFGLARYFLFVSYSGSVIIPEAIGASMVIGAMGAPHSFAAWLELPPFRFLGRVSYSFYLLHYPIFYVTAVLVSRNLDVVGAGFAANSLIAAMSIAVALGLAALSHRYVEMPCIRAGKRLAERNWITQLTILQPKTDDAVDPTTPRSN